MNELFDIPETPSPRLQWMNRYHITTRQDLSASENNKWSAFHGMDRIAIGHSEDSALTNAAKSLNIKLWNES